MVEKDEPQEHQFREVHEQAAPPREHLTMADLRPVRLMLTAELGMCKMYVRDVLDLKRGSVVPLDKLAGEMADLQINHIPFARGEIVVIGDSLHVRIGEIIGDEDKNRETYTGEGHASAEDEA